MQQKLIEIAQYPIYLLDRIQPIVDKEPNVVMKVEKRSNKLTIKKMVDAIILYKKKEFVEGGLNDFWNNLFKEVYGAGK